jgi:RHS repeat-associated protein
MLSKLQLTRTGICLMLLLAPLTNLFAQLSISGPNCVVAGANSYYTISGSYSSSATMQWCISGDGIILQAYGNDITGDNTCKSGTAVGSIVVRWNSFGSGSVTLTSSDGNPPTYWVTVVNALNPGSINGNKTQTIVYNTTPAAISCTGAVDGACSPSYSYQWQQSADNVTFTDVAGQTGQHISFSSPLITTTYYRRRVTETGTNTIGYADVATVYVNPPFSSVTIAPAVQHIFAGETPAAIGGPAATGGSCGGNYTYQWQYSTDGGTTYADVTSGTGGTGLTYAPGALNATTHFRRKDNCGSGELSYSNVAVVNVYQHLSAGTLSPTSLTITYGTAPGFINTTAASGGMCAVADRAYQWQKSTDNITFTDIPGATTYLNYDPGILVTTTYFRRRVTCGAETVYTNTVTIQVNPQVMPGIIVVTFPPISANTSPGLIPVGPASGGACNNNFVYQWQQSTDGVTYTNIAGANGLNYTPGNLTATTWFRRQVTCGIDVLYTNVCKVTVNTGPVVYNYIQTREITKPGIVDEASAAQLTDPADVKQTTQYFDGIGRLIQTVSKRANPLGNDLVVPAGYDEFGRETVKYLPYASTSTDGKYKVNAIAELNAFNLIRFPDEQYFYSRTDYESSPLNTVQATYAPGNSWVGNNRGVQNKSWGNTAIDAVRIWTVTDITGSFGSYSSPGSYNAGMLYKTLTIDEENHQVIEFKDKEGRVILKKVQLTAAADNGAGSGYPGWLCTYYIYDDFNNLRCVVQPAGVEMLDANGWNMNALNGDILSEQCFRYEYDARNRMIIKKVPGADAVNMVYDQRDRLVFTQDANMQSHQQWLGTLYDVLNRPVQTFMLTYAGTRAALQDHVNNNTGNNTNSVASVNGTTVSGVQANLYINKRQTGQGLYQGSTSITFDHGFITEDNAQFETEIVSPNGGNFTNTTLVHDNPIPAGASSIALTITSYDEYTATNKAYSTGNNSKLDKGANPYADALPAAASNMIRGKVTSVKVRVLENVSDLAQGQWLETASFYDHEGRVIQTQGDNYKGGNDIVTNLYSPAGQVLCSYELHNNASANLNNFPVKTNMTYDAAGRLLTVKKNLKDDNDAASVATTQRTIASYTYDPLGQVQEKKIGQKTISGSAPQSDPIENQVSSYNIRGWLLGINRDYVKDASTNFFGFELGYDKSSTIITGTSYQHSVFNGNIGGTVWRSIGDGEKRKYDFTYDAANRLTGADFNQYTGGNFNKTAGVDFSVSNLTYDANGNIKSMLQKGWKTTGSAPIDNLQYNYYTNSNRLKNIIDANNDPGTVLGDFRASSAYMTALGGTKTALATDYTYDANGNLTLDNNKDITGIVYNHLNLPYSITVNGKGTIIYIYDAGGNKLEKRVNEAASANNNNTAKQTTTSYLGGFVFENNVLQFFSHEEGRIRPVTPVAFNNNQAFAYDYLLKDHLGNTRAVLTDELQQDVYPAATLEGNPNNNADAVYTEKGYYNIKDVYIVNKPAGITDYANNNGNPPYNNNPNSNTSALSEKMYRLNSTDNKTGLGIALKVMAGDKVNIFGMSYYHVQGDIPNGTTPVPVLDILDAFAGAAVVSGKGISGSSLNGNTDLVSGIAGLLSNQGGQTSTQPKAYINWILLDERFNYAGGGFDRVGGNGSVKNHNNATIPTITVPKNGYIFVYCSNESNLNVFFDNLQIIHTKGPLVEETHYYPFGLTMAGISGKALGTGKSSLDCGCPNKKGFNGNEIQNKEFSDGSGLEVYDFNARTFDQQIGRFIQLDPMVFSEDFLEEKHEVNGGAFNLNNLQVYAFAYNNPIRYNDPDGKCPNCVTGAIGAGLGALIGGGFELGRQLWRDGKVTSWRSVAGATAQGAIAGGAAGFTGGGSLLTTAVTTGAANVVGGTVNRAIQGQQTNANHVITDFTVGAVFGAAGKYVENLATQIITRNALIKELGNNGIKHTANDIVAIGKNSAGKIIFMESGNAKAGLNHIIGQHGKEFTQAGIALKDIPKFIMQAVLNGKQVGMQGTRPIYEVTFNGAKQKVAVTVGNNGYVVGANMVSQAK